MRKSSSKNSWESSLFIYRNGLVDQMYRTQEVLKSVADPAVAQLRGVALYALVALGELDLDAVPALVPAATAFEPDPAAGAVYAPLYAEFTRVYGQLKGIYRRLNR